MEKTVITELKNQVKKPSYGLLRHKTELKKIVLP